MAKRTTKVVRVQAELTNGATAGEVVAPILTISEPNMHEVAIRICGETEYCQNRFSIKAREIMRQRQAEGSTAKKGRKRDPKNFEACFEEAQYRLPDGWGIPAGAFRNALVSACRLCGFAMTVSKLAVYIIADGKDTLDGTPLVRITKGKPVCREHPVRNESGVADIRARPFWEEGWEAVVRIRYDADVFTDTDVINLLMRVGCQVGIGEGRPDSKKSTGMGWGLFRVVETVEPEEESNDQ